MMIQGGIHKFKVDIERTFNTALASIDYLISQTILDVMIITGYNSYLNFFGGPYDKFWRYVKKNR